MDEEGKDQRSRRKKMTCGVRMSVRIREKMQKGILVHTEIQ